LLRTASSVLTALLLVLVAFVVIPRAWGEENPFSSVHVASNWGRYAGGCPVDLAFTGTINLRAHPNGLVFNYYWLRSDGSKSRTEVVRPGVRQRSVVVHEHWRLGGPGSRYSVSMRLFVNSGNTHIENSSQTVRVICR
jgi:hypothetical protein